ncbi:MAG: PrkA family serine protein kinase [Planctomycetota bacterium]|jgi:predicted Ser/Thr protein kinase
MSSSEQFGGLSGQIQARFRQEGRIRTFWEYLAEVREHPYRHLRSAAQYVRDMFEHFGSREDTVLGLPTVRHSLCDGIAGDPEQQRVVGQERAVDAIYRAVRNFAISGHADKLILTHGPNGSAKTTIADVIFKGLEAYSETPEGALYRFSWVFPKSLTEGGGVGFGKGRREAEDLDSFAHLEAEEIASTLVSDMKTNPIFLVPRAHRASFLQEICRGTPDFPHAHILSGNMGTKSRAIYEALLTAHSGDWRTVMRYVRVERFTISRRYRIGAVTIEPQGTVDADARQVTADMNLSNLPPALQNLRLFEVNGDLVDANRGVVEYSDFLKRPLELNKYLLTTTEKGTIRLPGALAYLDLVMIGSANEKHLDAFKTDPNFTSFKARMELVAVPYLLEYEKEVEIYRDQIDSIANRLQIAPHAARCAALWAVLTRLWRPDPANYEEPLRSAIPRLTPLAKALLYQERDPAELEDLDAADVKLFRGHLDDIAAEWRDGVVFEGRFGASPREMKTILLDASYRTEATCFTPMAVLAELRNLVRDRSVYDFLKLEPKGRYNNAAGFVEDVERSVVRVVLRELKDSMALVEEEEYDRHFEEYFLHVTAFIRGTRIMDPITGAERPPDPGVMKGVEDLIPTGEDINLFRQNLIGKIAAFSLNHPGVRVNYRQLFPDILRALKRDFYANRQDAITQVENDLLLVDTPAWKNLGPERQELVETTLANMESRYEYSRDCALEMIGYALRRSRQDAAQEEAPA